MMALAASPLRGQEGIRSPAPLTAAGFAPGQSLAAVAARARQLGGATLACDRSRADPRVLDCRALMRDSVGQHLDLWLSSVDSAVSILTLSTTLSDSALVVWQRALVHHYGPVPTQVQGQQRMMQWIRQNTMLRLTWRVENGAVQTSLSLVDGTLLDAWGRSTEQQVRPTPPPSPTAP
ncbi:MAG: hypothetical protein ACHQ2E_11260 [Gemmatimonadales bacterium]